MATVVAPTASYGGYGYPAFQGTYSAPAATPYNGGFGGFGSYGGYGGYSGFGGFGGFGGYGAGYGAYGAGAYGAGAYGGVAAPYYSSGTFAPNYYNPATFGAGAGAYGYPAYNGATVTQPIAGNSSGILQYSAPNPYSYQSTLATQVPGTPWYNGYGYPPAYEFPTQQAGIPGAAVRFNNVAYDANGRPAALPAPRVPAPTEAPRGYE